MTKVIPELVSITEAMRLTTLSRSTIDRLCDQGRLEKKRVSDGRCGITVASLERHLAELNGGAPIEAPEKTESRISRRQQALRAQSAARREARQSGRRAA